MAGTGDTITLRDGTVLHFKEWGEGPPIVFSHGWPLSADAWDAQMLFFASNGFRCIAHDRRGHGRSGQPSRGNDMDTYADDLAELVDALDLEDVVLVGHSTGGGEVVRYVARHGTGRVVKMVLVSAVPPLMVQTDTNPDGLPRTVFDDLRAALAADRSQLWRDLASGPFFGGNRPGAKLSQGTIDHFWLQGMLGGAKNEYECIEAFSATDFTKDLLKIDVPVLLIHGDDDQIVPFANSAPKAAKLLPNATLRVYRGGPHGLPVTHRDRLNQDVLSFVRRAEATAAPSASPPV